MSGVGGYVAASKRSTSNVKKDIWPLLQGNAGGSASRTRVVSWLLIPQYR